MGHPHTTSFDSATSLDAIRTCLVGKVQSSQGVVTPIGVIVTAVTGVKNRHGSHCEQEAVKKRSRSGQEVVNASKAVAFADGQAIKNNL